MSSEVETCEEVELSVEGEEIVCETVVFQSEEEEDDDDEHSETLSLEGHRPVRPVERQKMRPWLIDLLDKNILPGLNWQNKKENIFRISWKHAAHNCFNRNRDSDLFERWAVHTGRHHEGNHKRWKANFRCALNSLPDVMELKELGVRKGDNAFKVYKFLDSADPTMKEKMEIKRKYSLMAGIKLEESQSESSTPTVSTAPSSPDPENAAGVDGGIQTLLKAIELKTQQQDRSKTPQKRALTGGTTQTRSKKRKDSKDGDTPGIVYQLPMTITSGRPSPASTPGSEKSEDNEQLKMPYVGTIDPSTGKFMLVQLKKLHSPAGSPPIQPQVNKEPVSSATLTSPLSINAVRLEPQEQKVTIPFHLLQQELAQSATSAAKLATLQQELVQNQQELVQKQSATAVTLATLQQELLQKQTSSAVSVAALQKELSQKQSPAAINLATLQQELLQKQPPTAINIAALLAGNPTLQSILTSSGTIPLTVMEKQETKVTDKVPVPQLNKNITSIAAALRMANPVTMVTSTSSSSTQTVTAMPPGGGLASDPQGIRSKLVSRLMVSGSSMTSQATNVRMPTGIQISAPMAAPRPRLDHLLVKPNPSLTLPRTQLQPVKQSDHVVMATATSSNTETTGGPPKLITGSEKTIDLASTRGLLTTMSRSKDNGSLPMSTSGLSSPVCTPELRSDILDRQVTIELGKMEKEAHTTKPTDEAQHFSDNSSCSKRTVQTQCNMFLWSYLNGKLEDSAKSDPFLIPPLPPKKCNADPNPENAQSNDKQEFGRPQKNVIKQALDILRTPKYKTLSYKVIKRGKKRKKALIITNKEYFGVLGHNLDPLTLTLTSRAEVTLNIIFRPLEEFRLICHDASFHTELFRDILDRIISYWLCRGIKGKQPKGSNVMWYKYPFRRCQAENCILWFENQQEKFIGKFPVTQCLYCKKVDKSLSRTRRSVEENSRSEAAQPSQKVSIKEFHPKERPETSQTSQKVIVTELYLTERPEASQQSQKVIVKELYPTEITVKDLEKVVVEKIELADTVLDSIPEIPP